MENFQTLRCLRTRKARATQLALFHPRGIGSPTRPMVLATAAPASPEGDTQPTQPTETTKTTKLETTSSKDNAMRRLVEYFVVVSSVPKNKEGEEENNTKLQEASSFEEASRTVALGEDDEEFFVDDFDFQPVITARYPLEDHAKNPLHESVTFFCHPSGAIQLRVEQSMPKIHFFVATGGSGKKMYGTCLTLWEPYVIAGKKKDQHGRETSKKKEVYLPKCLVMLSSYPYLMAFREFLAQLNQLSKMGEMMYPVERYIANFCAEIPAPAPGAFEVQTTILDSVIRIWAPPHNQPIPWVSLPFAHLFECLDIDNIVKVWHCLALERQVLLTSTQLSLLTTCGEILISLLFPLRWSHAYIPLLPHFLVPMLSAPMPFFCGISKGNLASALCDLSAECVVVDLDMNLVTPGPGTGSLPQLPPQLEAALRARLNENVGMVFREARSLTKNDDYSERGLHLPPHIKLMADAMWEGRLCLFDEAFHLAFTPEESRKNLLNGNDTSGMDSDRDGEVFRIMTASERQNLRKQSMWDGVQEAFMDAFVYLLRNYRKFLVFPSKENEGAYGGAGFRSKEFVQSQRFDMQEFLNQLIGTQMFDNFVTKRLYGSGEADVAFFDLAVDKFLKNQGLLSNVDVGGRFRRTAGGQKTTNIFSKKPPPPSAAAWMKPKEPLLQSARVHRQLKTIVPPEPSGDGLPPIPLQNESQNGNGPVLTEYRVDTAADDMSVGSTSTQGTQSTRGTRGTAKSGLGSPTRRPKSIQDRAAEILEKSQYRYTYPTFPSEFSAELFGTPRPLPSAVIAEFDRQKSDAARFRRKQKAAKKGQLRREETSEPEAPPSPEVASFTLFFKAFSSVVGKELMDISENPLLAQDRTILSTYKHVDESDVESDAGNSVPTTDGSTVQHEEYEERDEAEKEGVAEMKATRPDLGGLLDDDDDDDEEEEVSRPAVIEPEEKPPTQVPEVDSSDDSFATPKGEEADREEVEEPKPVANGHGGAATGPKQRSRFTQSLSRAQIEEAKAHGRAHLALAFEMLTMMKKRGLKADPEAYQCLIDACGRVGDTRRATDLLARMHEDGIVADGVVYSSLVAAFSVDSAWKQASGDGKQDEDLPEWANSTSIEMDWNKLQQKSFLESAKKQLKILTASGENDEHQGGAIQRLRKMVSRKNPNSQSPKVVESIEFFVTEPVEMQIELGENLLEIVYPDISVDTDNETCPRCNYLLTDDDVVSGWTPSDSQDYTTSCPNCRQRFVPHFRVQSTSPSFMGSRGPASPLMCERLSPWVLEKEISTVMRDREGIENLLKTEWREQENKNAVLWWNLVLSCMRYRFPFSFLLQGSFEQNLIAPMPEQDE